MSHDQRTDEGRLRLLGAVRLLSGTYWILTLAGLSQLHWQFRTLPGSSWTPLYVTRILGHDPTATGMAMVWWVAMLAGSLLLIGFRTRITGPITAAAGILYEGSHLSFGKVTHGMHLLATIMLVFSFSDWGARFSMDRWMARRGGGDVHPSVTPWKDWPYMVVLSMTALAYLTSGLLKIKRGQFLRSGNMGRVLEAQIDHLAIRGRQWPDWAIEINRWLTEHVWAGDALSWGTVVLETFFFVFLFSARLRLLGLTSSWAFHGIIGTITSLTFWDRGYVLPLLFLPSLLIVIRARRPQWTDSWLPTDRVDAVARSWRGPVAAFLGTLVVLAAYVRVDPGWTLYVTTVGKPLSGMTELLTVYWIFPIIVVLSIVFTPMLIFGMARTAWHTIAQKDPLPRVHLLYDGTCGMCKDWVDWSKEHGIGDAVAFEPWVPHEHRLILEHVEMTWPGRERQPVVAAAAINEVWQRLPGWRNAPWRALSLLYRLEGFREVEEWCYRWVAENRSKPIVSRMVPGRGRR